MIAPRLPWSLVETDAQLLPMANNYRSGSKIVEAGNVTVQGKDYTLGTTAIAMRDKGTFEGVVRLLAGVDEDGECKRVAEEVSEGLKAPGASPADYAVLARSAVILGRYQVAFILASIPCAIVARNAKPFFARPEVRAVVDYLLLTEAWDPEAWARVYQEPRRGLGPEWAQGVAANVEAVLRRGYSADVLADAIDQEAGAAHGHRGREQAGYLATAFRELAAARQVSPAEAARRCRWMWLADSGVGAEDKDWEEYLTGAQGESDFASDKVDAILMVSGLLERFETPQRLSVFAARCRNETPEVGENDVLPPGRVVLSTVHGSKGLEWRTVYVSCTTGTFPSIRDEATKSRQEEARRLFYVAETRARDTLIYAYSDTLRGKPAGMSGLAEEVARALQIGPFRPMPPEQIEAGEAPRQIEEDDEGIDEEDEDVEPPLSAVEAWEEAIVTLMDTAADGSDAIGIEDVTIDDVTKFLAPLGAAVRSAPTAETPTAEYVLALPEGVITLRFPFGPDGSTGYRPDPIEYRVEGVKGVPQRFVKEVLPYPAGRILRRWDWQSTLVDVLKAASS